MTSNFRNSIKLSYSGGLGVVVSHFEFCECVGKLYTVVSGDHSEPVLVATSYELSVQLTIFMNYLYNSPFCWLWGVC